MSGDTPVFGIVGWKNSGKTTLMVGLVAALVGRGVRVSTVKHSHHGFDVDQPGKDSYRHREAGAFEAMVASSRRWAIVHELRDQPEPRLEDLVQRLAPADLVLAEGFKASPHAKLEVRAGGLDRPWIADDDKSVVALACDEAPPARLTLPHFMRDDIGAIADFVLVRSGLA